MHDTWAAAESLVVLGLNHEQQHQELLLTDIKHLAVAQYPVTGLCAQTCHEHTWRATRKTPCHLPGLTVRAASSKLATRERVLRSTTKRHATKSCCGPYQLANRCVTCSEYLAFIDDGGYERPEFWLSDGWAMRKQNKWRAPLYWQKT